MSLNCIFTTSALVGYLFGSIPFGLVLCYLAGYGDIRKIGSGNIGTTNVLRTGSKSLALLTLILDAFKAALAAGLALALVPNDIVRIGGIECNTSMAAALVAGTMAIIGHNFPIWLKFKGGKGVASSFGFLLVMTPQIALSAFAIWLAMAFIFRYSSLAAITAALATPFLTYFMSDEIHTVAYSLIVILLLVRHHANFARLFRGEESKITFKKKS